MALGEAAGPAPGYIRFGAVLAGVQPFTFNGNVNATFRGQVQLSNGAVVPAFIKDLDTRQFANELFAAVLGLRLGLPVPTPIIARASPDVLSASEIQLSGTDDHIVFASYAVGALPVLQVLAGAGVSATEVMKLVSEWSHIGELYGFDSWIANVDRHRGNLLLSGDGRVWLIDHGHSFTGPKWLASDLVPDAPVRNRLAEWLTPTLPGRRRSEAMAGAERLASEADALSVSSLGDAGVLRQVLGSDFNAIVAFVEARAAHIPELSKVALGLLV